MLDYAIIVAAIVGIVEIVKQFVPNKFMPIISVIIGIIAGLVYVDATIELKVFIGIAMGLAACGLFDVAKLPKKLKQ